jgi:undecaprenyl pyrophosphate phosphatase UppP
MPYFISIIILGIIEGITEFLPVSSTGHLLIAEHWLPRQTDLFNVVIQSGAVIAVIPLFSQRFHRFVYQWREPATRDYLLKLILAFVITGFGGLMLEKEGSAKFKAHDFTDLPGFAGKLKHPAAADWVSQFLYAKLSPDTRALLESNNTGPELRKALVKDLNQVLLDGPVYDVKRFADAKLSAETMKQVAENPEGKDLLRLNRRLLNETYPQEIKNRKPFKLPEELKPVGWALLIGGVLFLAVEYHLRGKRLGENVTWTIAIAVGLGQLVAAVFPGSSRSGTTILISLLLGLSRPAATEFSFLVSIPTMLAAGGYEIFEALHHPIAGTPPENWSMVILGTIVSAIVSFIAVKWLLYYVRSHTFNVFGYYRIIIGILVLIFLR